MGKELIMFLTSKLSPVAKAMLVNLAEARKTSESEAAIFLLNTCAMVERERSKAERIPYKAESVESADTINLIIAGSGAEFEHYLKTAVIEKTINEADKESYHYVHDVMQLRGWDTSKVKLHHWGNYSQNPVMFSDEYRKLRQELGLV